MLFDRAGWILYAAAAVSVALHAALLGGVTFTVPDPAKLFNDAPLEVALVNARSRTAPLKADVLAQANLDGGGNTDADRRLKSPLPAQHLSQVAEQQEQSTRRQVDLERQAQQLQTQLKSKASVASSDDKRVAPQPLPQGLDLEALREQSKEIARLESEISRDYDAYQRKPKKNHVGARAKSVPEALYVDAWREKIERVGTLNYPQDGQGRKLYGQLRLVVELRSDGSLEEARVDKSSGNTRLDEAALRILKLAAPFGPFPPAILDDSGGHRADRLVIVRTWTFSREQADVSLGR